MPRTKAEDIKIIPDPAYAPSASGSAESILRQRQCWPPARTGWWTHWAQRWRCPRRQGWDRKQPAACRHCWHRSSASSAGRTAGKMPEYRPGPCAFWTGGRSCKRHRCTGCRVVRLGDLKEKKRPHHVEKQLTNNSCWKGNWKTTSFNRDNGKLKISEVEQTALYLQSLQIESCLLLAIRFSDTDSWCPCILVLGYSIFSWLFRNCVYSSKKSITDAL